MAGNIQLDIYIGSTTCSGEIVASQPAFEYCTEGNDDGGDDDDDYNFADSYDNTYCVYDQKA